MIQPNIETDRGEEIQRDRDTERLRNEFSTERQRETGSSEAYRSKSNQRLDEYDAA